MSDYSAELARMKRLLEEATPGPLNPCAHLESIEADRACGCGYRGGVWTADGEHILFTMGEPVDSQFPGLEAPRIDRGQEIASAQLLVALYDNAPALIDAAIAIEARRAETAQPVPSKTRARAVRHRPKWVGSLLPNT